MCFDYLNLIYSFDYFATKIKFSRANSDNIDPVDQFILVHTTDTNCPIVIDHNNGNPIVTYSGTNYHDLSQIHILFFNFTNALIEKLIQYVDLNYDTPTFRQTFINALDGINESEQEQDNNQHAQQHDILGFSEDEEEEEEEDEEAEEAEEEKEENRQQNTHKYRSGELVLKEI